MKVTSVQLSESELTTGVLAAKSLRRAKKSFLDDGTLLIRNVFTRQLISRLRGAYFRRYCELDADELAAQFAMVGDHRYMINVLLNKPFLTPKLYANPLLTPMLDRWLGADHQISSFGSVVSFPGAAGQPIHFDFPPLFESEELCCELPPYAITMIVPLVDLTIETGTTAVWPGSHNREGARKELSELASSGSMEGSDLPLARAGDVLFMDMRLIHAGTPNVSSTPRPILYIAYSRPWFRDHMNFGEQPAINILPKDLRKVPSKHKHLFSIASP